MSATTEISILIGKASGIVLRVCVCLINQGYRIHGQRLEDDAGNEHVRLIVALAGDVRPIPEQVYDALREIPGCVSVEHDAASAMPTPTPTPEAAGEEPLLDAVRALFEGVYGAATDGVVERLAEAASPVDSPKLFLDQCKAQIGGVVGDAIAENMLKALYERFG